MKIHNFCVKIIFSSLGVIVDKTKNNKKEHCAFPT